MKKLARRDNKVRNIAGFIYAFEAFSEVVTKGYKILVTKKVVKVVLLTLRAWDD